MTGTSNLRRESNQTSRAKETRRRILSVSRDLFGRRGYSATSIEEILRATKLTRGALYYHFDDKAELFRAVAEAVTEDAIEQIREIAWSKAPGSPWQRLVSVANAIVEAFRDETVRRILLEDGPSVLGWSAIHEIDERYALPTLMRVIQQAIDAGELAQVEVEPLARILLAGFREVAWIMALAPGSDRGESARSTMQWLLNRVRTSASNSRPPRRSRDEGAR